jgi:hypothetical protein
MQAWFAMTPSAIRPGARLAPADPTGGATYGIVGLPYSWGRSRREMVAATKATRRRFDGARYHANPYFDPWAFAGVRRDGARNRWTGHHAADCPCRACTRAYGHPVDRW